MINNIQKNLFLPQSLLYFLLNLKFLRREHISRDIWREHSQDDRHQRQNTPNQVKNPPTMIPNIKCVLDANRVLNKRPRIEPERQERHHSPTNPEARRPTVHTARKGEGHHNVEHRRDQARKAEVQQQHRAVVDLAEHVVPAAQPLAHVRELDGLVNGHAAVHAVQPAVPEGELGLDVAQRWVQVGFEPFQVDRHKQNDNRENN